MNAFEDGYRGRIKLNVEAEVKRVAVVVSDPTQYDYVSKALFKVLRTGVAIGFTDRSGETVSVSHRDSGITWFLPLPESVKEHMKGREQKGFDGLCPICWEMDIPVCLLPEPEKSL